jgi:hypothetical protein
MKAACCSFEQSLQPVQPRVFTSSATWASRSAPGVPGRGEYLNENACA